MTIELKIQVSSPDMLRDTLMAFGAVFGSGLVKPTDQVTLTATETSSPATEIEAWIDQAPDAQLPEEFAAATEPDPEPVSQPEKIEEVEPEPAPKKRGRPRKSAAAVEPVPDVEPEPEVVTEEEEPEAIGADEPPAPEPIRPDNVRTRRPPARASSKSSTPWWVRRPRTATPAPSSQLTGMPAARTSDPSLSRAYANMSSTLRM